MTDLHSRSVLRAQRALLPAHGRRFPEVVPLAHDVVAWHHDMLVAKAQGHHGDWPEVVPRLASYGAGELIVDDPDHVVDTSIGLNRELNVVGVNWELDSPLSRAARHRSVHRLGHGHRGAAAGSLRPRAASDE